MEFLPKEAKINYPREEIVLVDVVDKPGALYATYICELIRCKDCLFYSNGRNGTCLLTTWSVTKEDYCSRGRKQ